MRYCQFSTGWVWVVAAYWRASVVQHEPQSDERWRVHIYCAFRTPPYYGGYDSAYLLHADGEPYSAPLTDSIHRAERWYWRAALGCGLNYGPNNPQPEFERANGIPATDDPLARSGGVVIPAVSEYPERDDRTEFHSTPPLVCKGQRTIASVVRDNDTREWGIWVAGETPGWLKAGGAPYRAPATVCSHRAERWYWQTVYGVRMPHGENFPQPGWEQDNRLPDLDDHLQDRDDAGRLAVPA